MLNLTEKQKIKGFMADSIMSGAVEKVLMATFTKASGEADVQTLAAERIAINLLKAGFKELDKQSKKSNNEDNDREKNVGL